MWDYYGKRWDIYIREATSALIAGMEFDNDTYKSRCDKFQEKWVTSTEEVPAGTISEDILTHSRALRDKYRQQLEAFATK